MAISTSVPKEAVSSVHSASCGSVRKEDFLSTRREYTKLLFRYNKVLIIEYLSINVTKEAMDPIKAPSAGVMGADFVRFGGVRSLLSNKRCKDSGQEKGLLFK